jgi:hypothetical protein
MYAPHDRPYAGVIQGARYNLIMFDPRAAGPGGSHCARPQT